MLFLPLGMALTIWGLSPTEESGSSSPRADSTLGIYILAGQSNALNWHCDAALLPPDSTDASVLFFYHSGAPPDRSYPIPFNATSGGTWVPLGPQHQDPYIAHRENFFGPEMGLGRELAGSGMRVGVLKCAYFGTDLAFDWRKGATSGAGLYPLMLQQIATAERALDSAGIGYAFKGFFWMQGESDAASSSSAAAYHGNLVNFIRDVRADIGVPLPFILGRIGSASSYPYKNVIRTAQMDVAAAGENVRWVDTDDLPLDADNVHLLAPGALLLGERMANAFRSLPTGISSPQPPRPAVVTLEQNFPNPFNPTTTIQWTGGEAQYARLDVYDVLGRVVATLMEGEIPAGRHLLRFDASGLAGGVYFYRLAAGQVNVTRMMVVAK